MADAPQPSSLDVKQLVDSSGKTYKVEELANSGFKEIQVLEKNAFNRLLQEAVDRVLSVRGSVLSHEERQKVMEETKMELRLLAQESDMIKQKSERDRESLLREVENLQQQLIMHRKLTQEQDRVRFDEGARSLQPVVEQLRQRVSELERDLAAARNEATSAKAEANTAKSEVIAAKNEANAAKSEASAAKNEANAAKSEASAAKSEASAAKNEANAAKSEAAEAKAQVLKAKASADVETQAQAQAQAASAEAAAKAQAQMAQQMAAQMAAMQAMLDQRLKAVEETAAKPKEPDTATLDAMMAMHQQSLAAQQAALAAATASKKEEGKGPDFEKMMMRLGDTLGRKIASIKSGDEGAATEYSPSEITMKGMLSTEGMESNLSTMDTKQEVAKGAGAGALAKLKAMKGGGAPAPAPETPK